MFEAGYWKKDVINGSWPCRVGEMCKLNSPRWPQSWIMCLIRLNPDPSRGWISHKYYTDSFIHGGIKEVSCKAIPFESDQKIKNGRKGRGERKEVLSPFCFLSALPEINIVIVNYRGWGGGIDKPTYCNVHAYSWLTHNQEPIISFLTVPARLTCSMLYNWFSLYLRMYYKNATTTTW